MAGSNRYGRNWYNYDSKPKFTIYINEGERYQIENWVSKHQNIETGGDLFGLWIDKHTAVVQFVLGPGEGCRRTSVSFYQDIEYLRKAGNYLTQKHGLCNIGQWHSHHRLGLTRPSGGDENTVWGNMPKLGLNRYIVFIATINGGYYRNEGTSVDINPYLFEIEGGRRNDVAHGKLQYLKFNSPFRLDTSIQMKVKHGAEIIIKPKVFTEEGKDFQQKPDRGKRPNKGGNETERVTKKRKPEEQGKFQESSQEVLNTRGILNIFSKILNVTPHSYYSPKIFRYCLSRNACCTRGWEFG